MNSAVFRRGNLSGQSSTPPKENEPLVEQSVKCHPKDSNLVCSEIAEDQHYVLLDLDVPHAYSPSSTVGHGHLYIDKVLPFEDYLEILQVLSKHGIIEAGFYEWTKRRGYAALRPPGISKHNMPDNMIDPSIPINTIGA